MIGEAFAAAGGALVLQYISTGIKVAEFLMSERLPVTISNIRSYFSRNKIKRPDHFDPENAEEFVGAMMKIDKRILDKLTKSIDDAIKAYIKCLDKAKSDRQARFSCDIKVERSICETLNRIMDRNNDQLPDPYLRNQWDSFKCQRF